MRGLRARVQWRIFRGFSFLNRSWCCTEWWRIPSSPTHPTSLSTKSGVEQSQRQEKRSNRMSCEICCNESWRWRQTSIWVLMEDATTLLILWFSHWLYWFSLILPAQYVDSDHRYRRKIIYISSVLLEDVDIWEFLVFSWYHWWPCGFQQQHAVIFRYFPGFLTWMNSSWADATHIFNLAVSHFANRSYDGRPWLAVIHSVTCSLGERFCVQH